jgi:predicted ATPase
MRISKIEIENFKSIKKLDLSLNNINILIGQNGAGKSNFVQFYNLLNNLVQKNLQNYVATNGGADSFLLFGRKRSDFIKGKIDFGLNAYDFKLIPTMDNNLIFGQEITKYYNPRLEEWASRDLATSNKETNLIQAYHEKKSKVINYILTAMVNWRVYHFHDTSSTSKMKHEVNINDNRSLRRDASNLAAFLFLMQNKTPEYFNRIENTIKLIAPFFEKFQLEPLALNPEKVKLEWKHIGSDDYFNANHLSDGTLRMICLITLLCQPSMPDTIIIDEPELGLHPAAIELLAAIIKSAAANNKQIICSTQSVTLLNHFQPEDIVVVDRNNGESLFRRLDREQLKDWLDEYSIGELWEKNVLGGRP